MNKIKTNNKIMLGLSTLFILISPFTLEGFILELILLGMFYKQYRLYCKKCRPKQVKYDILDTKQVI